MYNPDAGLLTLDELQEAREIVTSSPHYIRTPMLLHAQKLFPALDSSIDLSIKLENMQVTGSFKVRGTLMQFHRLPEGYGTDDKKIIVMSGGNYGKTVAYLGKQMGLKIMVVMADTAPENRAQVIKSYGAEFVQAPTPELTAIVEKNVKERNMIALHYDDVNLMAGYASIGFEMLEDVSEPEVVLLSCGGGALMSGIAAGLKLSGLENCRIYGVEPEGSRTMYESLRAGHPVGMAVKSVAAGLSPPYTGPNAYRHCKEFVEDILLVTDDEILAAMFALYDAGVLAEPSAAAAFAALYHNKVPDVHNKKVVVLVTGGNVTPEELQLHSKSRSRRIND